MIEDRLRRTLEQVAAGGLDEAGAFDRFLRRRARRARMVAGATALVLVAALASAVALPRLVGDGTQRRLDVTGVPGAERWLRGPLVAVAPLQGFEVEVPAGWEAAATWKGVDLRPTSPDLRRRLAGPVQLDTSFLAERDNPAPNAWKDGRYVEEGGLPWSVSPTPRGDRSSGSFPGDRRWFRLDGQDGRWRTTQWHISWPYRCEPGVPCPAQLALRTLRVAFRADGDAWPRAAGLAERLLGTARPIANAVVGQRHAPRPDCVDGRTVVSERLPDPRPYAPNGVTFGWRVRTTPRLVPCTLRGQLAVELRAGGRRADIQGNAVPVTMRVDFPEGRAGSPEVGVAQLLLRWSNWCGGPVRVRWLDGNHPDDDPQPATPDCRSTASPSVLRFTR